MLSFAPTAKTDSHTKFETERAFHGQYDFGKESHT